MEGYENRQQEVDNYLDSDYNNNEEHENSQLE